MQPIAMIFILIGALFLLLWIPLLVFGIVRWRRGSRNVGIFCTLIGGLWGVGAMGTVILAMVAVGGYQRMARQFEFTPFDPESHDGPAGTVALAGAEDACLQVASRDGQQLLLTVAGGEAAAPAGEFELRSGQLTGVSSGGQPWVAFVRPPHDRPLAFEVPADGETTLALGPPFRATVSVERRTGGRHAFSLQVSDAAGLRATIHSPDNRVPELRILDADGEILLRQDFEYG